MPVTRSESLYFLAGVAVGALARGAYPKLAERWGPLVASAMAGARDAFGDACAEAARHASGASEGFSGPGPGAHRTGPGSAGHVSTAA